MRMTSKVEEQANGGESWRHASICLPGIIDSVRENGEKNRGIAEDGVFLLL